MAGISTSGHSAIVHITLQVGEETLPVAQLGPNFLILAQATSLPSCEGTVTLEVDGKTRTFPVWLPAGSMAGERKVVIEKPLVREAAAA